MRSCLKITYVCCVLFVILFGVSNYSTAPAFGQQMSMNQMQNTSMPSSGNNQQMAGMSNSSMGGMSMSGMQMSNQNYTISAAGNIYIITVSSNGNLPSQVQFNQDQKAVSFTATGLASRDLSHYEVTIPTALLSGNFTVMVGSSQIKAVSVPNQTSTIIHINIPSSFVKQNGIGDSSIVLVAGTQAVPEFGGMVPPILIISILIVVIISGKFHFRILADSQN